jgi:presqualene diphosphate synthase
LALLEAAAASDTAAERAASSSFYNAMRILPRAQRQAMFEIYAFCRQVDDIADSSGARAVRRQQLDRWRADIDALYAGRPVARTQGLAAPVWDFALQQVDFRAIIDGMEMDVVVDIRAPDDETFDLYCDRVASAVGRLSVRVFGMEEREGLALAHHLGRALQLTNILRDLDEDAAVGRLYLPSQALRVAGIAATDPATVLLNPALGTACQILVERARAHFANADTIMTRSPRRLVRAPRIMAEAYRAILGSLVERGWSYPRRPIHIPRARLLWIIMRHAFV